MGSDGEHSLEKVLGVSSPRREVIAAGGWGRGAGCTRHPAWEENPGANV